MQGKRACRSTSSAEETNMAWYSGATKKALTTNFVRGKMIHPIKGLVIHITDTKNETLEALFNDFNNPNQQGPKRSAHFGVAKDGEIWQFVDSDDVAFAVDGVWGGDGVDNHWVSVENVAKFGEKLTDDQILTLAELLDWLHGLDGVPYTLANSKNDQGLGYHKMFNIGNHACPGLLVVNQRQAILNLTDCGL
jgi:N-acetylmuramoyl-L-alanine amidase-like protein